MKRRFNIQDVDINYVGDDWRCGVASLVKRDIENIQKCIVDYENTLLTFKSSSKKSDSSLRYIPVNLHLHVFKMSGESTAISTLNKQEEQVQSQTQPSSPPSLINYTCDFMTVGAFAAHSMKFKAGGLWHMMHLFDERLSKHTKGLIPPLKNDFRLPDEVRYIINISILLLFSPSFLPSYLLFLFFFRL